MIRSATIAALLAAAATSATAQTLPALQISPGATLLNINAEGRSRRAPDVAIFSAGVVTHGKTAAAALSANAERMDSVIRSNLSVQPQVHQPERDPSALRRGPGVAPREPEAPRIVGYEARNSAQARVRRLKEMGGIIDALVSAGANQVDGPSFSLDEPDTALDEARAEAMRRARQRADLYARSADRRVGRIVSIREQGGYYPVTDIVVTGMRGGVAAPPPPPSPVQPGELTLGVNLSVQFELVR